MRTRLPLPPVLVQVLVLVLVPVQARSVSAGRSDTNMVVEESVSATVNATVLDGRGNAIHVISSDDGKYGQNSPKVDTRGVIVAPAPHHGGGCRQSDRVLTSSYTLTMMWIHLSSRPVPLIFSPVLVIFPFPFMKNVFLTAVHH